MKINSATQQRRRQTLKWLQNLESSRASLCDMSRPNIQCRDRLGRLWKKKQVN